MPNWSTYKRINNFQTDGQARKVQSDKVMEATWYEDIATRTCYFYDWYHDSEPLKLRDLHPQSDKKKIPIDVKFLSYSSQTYDKDQITFHIQFKPSHRCAVPYYKEFFEDRYDAIYPIGLYVDIPDNQGQYNRWLVVDKANFYDTQFSTFEVLPCDKIIRYIIKKNDKSVKYAVPGVLRSQNSYNSGLWTDFKITSTEDQQKFAVPLNRDTELIYYNQRMIIDNKVLTEPRTWDVSKINRLSPNGICRVTLAQTEFNEHTDYRDEDGNWWADYNYNSVTPEEFNPTPKKNIYSKLFYSDIENKIRVGGNFTDCTVKFFEDDVETRTILGNWKFFFIEKDPSGNEVKIDASSYIDVDMKSPTTVGVKFIGSKIHLRKVLSIEYDTGNGSTSSAIRVQVSGL